MHISKFLALPLVAVAAVSGLAVGHPENTESGHGLSKRSCYLGGVEWGNEVGLAINAVDKACRDKLIGSYKGKSERSACYNLGSRKRVNFNVRRWADSPADLTIDDCIKYLRLEIVGCDMGGMSYQGNWRFMSDPNSGGCS
ncbi:hypothetical protein JX266_013636 [Neoarthrinium moseri]|uniref:uncharacterized protein n=1 Tax=Neoarthrinium moseri TaxID=1658444 RepID=UPI001FDBCA5F|nr:uncharacterized protein JN550_011840 [Neoarthrinium moseri]KAI1840162.1 hypothetical protein JX266_013636 [Neoarthrinium moseri]KAI1859921.1 hypothetical protein JN550_011840 [Neoarthrinium moseri]